MAATIKNKIRNIRELKNYTQEYMAERLGVTQAGYSKIEKGKTSLSYEKLVDIGKILDVTVEDIISFEYDKYFSNFNNNNNSKITGNNNGSILINADNSSVLKELYEDKIQLLEKLLNRTENELQRYKIKFGEI
ncbi:helix-turn-helix transcriptional regulator [Flavobacterium phragmitis]|uniref:DNA-binding transcriptional regulator, XRE-family HTH domain n=1 Tax=Flavobacterium phragmitis TaxID=739143 RepID=A0A1I1NTX4_9FLAO|nr:helix-turn-helix transcriptional regulator [Flavobacterium phragmitis]SFC97190.1 DNA-binding transcriptional regulator, XRE-family HTH domain [Flavobacterium phragmitis]